MRPVRDCVADAGIRACGFRRGARGVPGGASWYLARCARGDGRLRDWIRDPARAALAHDRQYGRRTADGLWDRDAHDERAASAVRQRPVGAVRLHDRLLNPDGAVVAASRGTVDRVRALGPAGASALFSERRRYLTRCDGRRRLVSPAAPSSRWPPTVARSGAARDDRRARWKRDPLVRVREE